MRRISLTRLPVRGAVLRQAQHDAVGDVRSMVPNSVTLSLSKDDVGHATVGDRS